LILPPAADQALWYAAIDSQAKARGLSLTIGNAPKGADLVLTPDIEAALNHGAKPHDMAVLISQAGLLSEELAGLEPNTQRHNPVMVGSSQTLSAYQLPADRRFLAQEIARGPVGLFDDFSLHLPEAKPDQIAHRNRALAQAMTLYSEDRVIWPIDILDIYARILDRSAGSISLDATGKPRFIAHGPYLTMPAGTYSAALEIEFNEPLCDKTFSVHWGGVSEFSQMDFKPDKAGAYRVELDWTWTEPAPAEFRLIAREGIFDGVIKLSDIEISRIG